MIEKDNLRTEIKIWINLIPLFLMVLWLIISLATTKYYEPFIAWHTITGHHFLVLIFGFIVPFFYLWLYAKFRPLYAFIIIAFVIAVNEWSWWISYFLIHYVWGFSQYYLPPNVYNKFTIQSAIWNLTIRNFLGWAYIIIFVTFLKFIKVNKGFVIWLSVFITIYIYWLSSGFPITIDFNGITTLYFDPTTNIIEILHWIIPIYILLIYLPLILKPNNNLKGFPPSVIKLFFKGKPAKEIAPLLIPPIPK